MFYGLNKIIKNILPKSLFYRALLIVAVPVLVLQVVVTVVFFDSLWIKTTKGMTRALVNEMSTFIEFYKNDEVIGCYPCSELEGVGADTTCSESPCADHARPGAIIYIKGY